MMFYVSIIPLIVWVSVFSLIGTIMTMIDKQKARQGRRRISEKKLLWMGALGGALLMWVTMIMIHHKTHRNKFMIGLPVMFVIQVALFALAWQQNEIFLFIW